ncbi:expressed unknown protein [Seminavis robusta]|uniref:Uncharacterized protein n=1 Tax=Seminavis robusta TaxID=568900 RepID=A0A9N8DW50_9STRA|nr:expressed unknown protein [Seminavis robusta]|eukprot:Sro292_g109590.1 n/a (1179) ;mRNA; f:18887-22778
MTTSFERTVGPKADYQELEYISALHQTGVTGTRTTGTISSLDVLRFLKSRHSIDITHEQAIDIVRGLGGVGGADGSPELKMSVARSVAERIRSEREQQRLLDEQAEIHPHLKWTSLTSSKPRASTKSAVSAEASDRNTSPKDVDEGKMLVEEVLNPKLRYLDLVQMTSIILIPTLARMAQEWRQASSNNHSNLGNDEKNQQETKDEDDKEENGTAEEDFAPLDPQPNGLLEFVLENMIRVVEAHDSDNFKGSVLGEDVEVLYKDSKLSDDRSDERKTILTPDLVEALLLENGETERAHDTKLIREMVEMAQSKSGTFDVEALANALTLDLQDWNVGCEDRESTYFSDVFGQAKTDNEFNEFITGVTAVDWESTRASAKPASKGAAVDDAVSNKKDHDGASSDDQSSFPASVMKDEPSTPDGEEEAAPPQPDSSMIQTNDMAEMEASATPRAKELKVKGSAKVIDTVVDAYASHGTLALVWVTYVCYSGSYASLILLTDSFQTECPGRGPHERSFGCTLGKTVYTWIIVALILTGFGFAVLVPLAFGNHPTKRGPIRMFVASVMALVITLVPFCVVYRLQNSDVVLYGPVQEQLDSDSFYYFVYFTTALGCMLGLNYFAHFAISFGKKFGLIEKDNNKLSESGTVGRIIGQFDTSSEVSRSASVKRAATRKVNVMLTNARQMHGPAFEEDKVPLPDAAANDPESRRSIKLAKSIRKAQSDAVFQNFTLRGERTVEAGSLLWSWGMMLSGGLWEVEGIWLPSRMIIFQLAQVAIGVFFAVAIFIFVEIAADAADQATAEIESKILKQVYYPQWVISFVPTGGEVKMALIPAGIISVLVCFALTLIYIPSTVKTVLRYRCGQLPSLGAEDFHGSRAKADMTYMNTANAIYGMLAGGTLFFVLFGLLIFFFIWDFTQDVMLLILAWGIGLTITTLVKSLMVSFCRKRLFRAFYRVFPGRSNYVTLALECWYIGLGGGVLIGRLTQFLLASAFWIGRIDEPFLAPNVNLLGYKFDYVPLNYSSEILIHEAHRHPFIERLGTMYLMRLRYPNFGSNAGACWRQLFVITLMPWLMKNRVFYEQRAIESIHDQKSELELEMDEDKQYLEIAGELLDVGADQALTFGKFGLGTVDIGARAVGQVGMGAVEGVKTVGNFGVDTTDTTRHDNINRRHEEDPLGISAVSV